MFDDNSFGIVSFSESSWLFNIKNYIHRLTCKVSIIIERTSKR